MQAFPMPCEPYRKPSGGLRTVRLSMISFLTAFFVLIGFLSPPPASARGLSLIRDAEIEHAIRSYATPLFQAAGLTPSAVKIYLVKDRSLNAFVAGGQNLFVHTGLITASDHAGQIIGVLAHETGHISGGHIARTGEAIENASMQSIIATALSLLAGIAAGRPDVVVASQRAGDSMAMRNFLSYSRMQESAADAAALSFLDATGQSAKGLDEFYGKLRGQESLIGSSQDPYVRTHPLTQRRMQLVRNHLERSPYANAPVPREYEEMHARMVAKLDAFMDSPLRTMRKYGHQDRSIAARYARAIASYRQNDLDTALPLIDGLILEHPNDAYFHELKGQILFEHSRIQDSLASYRKAVEHAPRSALLRIALAHNLISLGRQGQLEEATQHLQRALQTERRNYFGWRLMGQAQGRLGRMGQADLALAEAAVIARKKDDARHKAQGASEKLQRHSPGWLRAQDILRDLDRDQ